MRAPCSDRAAATIFSKAHEGQSITEGKRTHFASFMMLFFGRLDAKKGWTKQLHLGRATQRQPACPPKNVEPMPVYDTVGDLPQIIHSPNISICSPRKTPAADDPVQREPRRHISVRDADWLLFRMERNREKSQIRQRTGGSSTRKQGIFTRESTRCEYRPASRLHRHGHRPRSFSVLPSATNISAAVLCDIIGQDVELRGE